MTSTIPFFALTAGDLMTRPVVTLTERTPLREAARLLALSRVHGAPVVDGEGRCVGVLTVSDLARWAMSHTAPARSSPWPGGPDALVSEFLGVCVFQRTQWRLDGRVDILCTRPAIMPANWQESEVRKPAEEVVRLYMTGGPVTATEDVPIGTLARQMTDARVHRVIVVDHERRPVGIVSSTDLLAALACAE